MKTETSNPRTFSSMLVTDLIPIRTERLLLDRFYQEDWQAHYQMELTPEDHRFNGNAYNPKSEAEIQSWIRDQSQQEYNKLQLRFTLAARLQSDRSYLGFLGFKGGTLTQDGTTEIYYSFYKDYWNRGYCTEAVRAMLKFGFEQVGLHRIWAGCDIDNYASQRVMEKAGMTKECHWRKDRRRGNRWQDGYGYAILKEDFRA